MRFLLIFAFIFFIGSSFANAQENPLDSWVAQLRQEALARGVSPTIFDNALAGFEPMPDIIRLDHKQPEKTKNFAQYVAGAVNPSRIAKGRTLLKENKALLDKISARYGVKPQYIVALWGMETSYGQNTGGFSVVDSLATLAYDGRRAAFFREELLQALQILSDGHITLDDMIGSWAGAMGQCQFMPSSYRKFAVDENGDGRSDIWQTRADVFASIANYLTSSGWKNELGWGREVQLPDGFDPTLADIKVKRPVREWARLGVSAVDGMLDENDDAMMALIYPDDTKSSAYLVSANYDVIMTWNKSRYFATSVGLLANALARP